MITLSRKLIPNRWMQSLLLSTGLAFLMYLLNWHFSEIRSGNYWGLTYGILATVLMVLIALFGARRRLMNWGYLPLSTWLNFHIYFGVVFMLLVFMHVGFKLPRGPLNWLIWSLSIWVTLSGFIGLFLQQWLPRILGSGLLVEAVYERIPFLVAEIRERALLIAQSGSEPLQEFHEKSVAPVLRRVQPAFIYYFDITGGIQDKLQRFTYLERFLDASEKSKLNELEALYKTKLELDAQFTLQRVLRLWLYLHLPASLILLVAVCLHIFIVLAY